MKHKRVAIFILISIFLSAALYAAHADEGLEKKDYWASGQTRICKRYNKLGDLVETSYYREDGTVEQREKYDSLGNKIEEAYYDSSGNLRENPDGWAVIRKEYKDGNMVMESYYGADGHLKERKQYNDLGDLVSKQYVGDDILPAEEYNPIPTVAGEAVSYYDTSGRPEGTTEVINDDPWWYRYRFWRSDEG